MFSGIFLLRICQDIEQSRLRFIDIRSTQSSKPILLMVATQIITNFSFGVPDTTLSEVIDDLGLLELFIIVLLVADVVVAFMNLRAFLRAFCRGDLTGKNATQKNPQAYHPRMRRDWADVKMKLSKVSDLTAA